MALVGSDFYSNDSTKPPVVEYRFMYIIPAAMYVDVVCIMNVHMGNTIYFLHRICDFKKFIFVVFFHEWKNEYSCQPFQVAHNIYRKIGFYLCPI